MILKESKNVSIENQVVCEIVASRSLKRGMLTKNCTVPSRNIAKSIDCVRALLVSEPIDLLQAVIEKFVYIPS